MMSNLKICALEKQPRGLLIILLFLSHAFNFFYMMLIFLFQIETISGMLVLRWVNAQLQRISNWVERAIQQEVCAQVPLKDELKYLSFCIACLEKFHASAGPKKCTYRKKEQMLINDHG